MDQKDILKFIKLCKKYGIKTFELNGLKLDFLHEAVTPNVKGDGTSAITSQDETLPPRYTDEQIIHWSVPGDFQNDEVS
jgi:hypothetical protein